MKHKNLGSFILILIGVFILLPGILPLHNSFDHSLNKFSVWEDVSQDASELENDLGFDGPADILATETTPFVSSIHMLQQQLQQRTIQGATHSSLIAKYLLFGCLKLSYN